MKIVKLDYTQPGFAEAFSALRQKGAFFIRGWAAVPDNHGLKAPLLVKEYSKAKDAQDDGCPTLVYILASG